MATQYEKDLPEVSDIDGGHVRAVTSAGESVRVSLPGRVRAVVLTGLSTATNAAIAATDSILAALGKLQAQINALGSGKQDKLPTTANTYYRRNAANTANDAVTPQAVADEISPLLLAGPYMTYGGTADAVTLTSANQDPVTALKVGMQVRFRATAANTGAMTFAVDGLAPVAGKTITGADTPAGYIRTDVDTVATFDGVSLIVHREIERGSNANGEYVRWADGTQITTKKGHLLPYISGAYCGGNIGHAASFASVHGHSHVFDDLANTASITYEQLNAIMSRPATSTHIVDVRATSTDGVSFSSGDSVSVSVIVWGTWY